MSNEEAAFNAIMHELRRAEEKHPGWPDDPIHGAAIVAEEAGELSQKALDFFYRRSDSSEDMAIEAAHAAAAAWRFLIYFYGGGDYKRQEDLKS
jgi:hypothetical protein